VEEVNQEATIVTLSDDVECNRLNDALDKLGELGTRLQADGQLTVDVALEHQALTGSNTLVNTYYSTLGKQQKLKVAQEGLYEQAKSLLKKAMDLLWEMIVKVWKWLQKLFVNGVPMTEAALARENEKFKSFVMPVQKAERVPSSRTAIIQAVREEGLNEAFVSKLTPEEMDIYNEGPYHQAVQRMIPALDGFNVASVVETLVKWHEKWLPAGRQFDQDNAGTDPHALQDKLERFQKDAQTDLEHATSMATKLMQIRLESYQTAVEARRKLKVDPNFHLGTDLSGIMARGVRIYDQSGYKKMGSALTDVFKSLDSTVKKMESIRTKAYQNPMPNDHGGAKAGEEWIEQIYMKEVNRIISTLHQCVSMIQLINNYYSFVVGSGKTIMKYVMTVAQKAIQHGGDAASLQEIVRSGSSALMGMAADGSQMAAQQQAAGMQTDMGQA
jgi:hypothetical protein